jgi:hypothetical protein
MLVVVSVTLWLPWRWIPTFTFWLVLGGTVALA